MAHNIGISVQLNFILCDPFNRIVYMTLWFHQKPSIALQRYTDRFYYDVFINEAMT